MCHVIARCSWSNRLAATLLAVLACLSYTPLRGAEPEDTAAADAAVTDTATVAPSRQDNWPSFRHDIRQTGVASSDLPEKLELLWKFKAGEMVTSTAAIVDGQVFVASLKGEVTCLDLKSGQPVWVYHSKKAAAPDDFLPGFKASPLVTETSVFLGDEDGVFHAIDRKTGKRQWVFQSNAEIISSATPYDDQVLFGSYDSNLYCLKASSGEQVWQFTTEDRVNCSPAISGHFTFVAGCDAHLRVIDILTGKQQTDIPLGTYLIASPAVAGDLLYVGTFESEVVALNWKKAERVWTQKDPKREFPYHSSAAITDQVVVVGGQDKRVHCLRRQDGQELWTFTTRGKVNSSPVIVGDRVFVGSNDGNLYGLRLKDGTEFWRHTDGRPFSASPAVGNGCLVIGSESSEGFVYCFGKKH